MFRLIGDVENVDPELLDWLGLLSQCVGVPLVINSGHREGDEKSHGKGKAVDVQCTNSRMRYLVAKYAFRLGVSRIGVYPRHVHLDIDEEREQQVLWLGEYNEKEEDE